MGARAMKAHTVQPIHDVRHRPGGPTHAGYLPAVVVDHFPGLVEPVELFVVRHEALLFRAEVRGLRCRSVVADR